MKKYYFTDAFIRTIRSIHYSTSEPKPELIYMEEPKTVERKCCFGLIKKTETIIPGYYYRNSDNPSDVYESELFHIGEDVYTKPLIRITYKYGDGCKSRKTEITYDTDEEMMEVFEGISVRVNLTEF